MRTATDLSPFERGMSGANDQGSEHRSRSRRLAIGQPLIERARVDEIEAWRDRFFLVEARLRICINQINESQTGYEPGMTFHVEGKVSHERYMQSLE